MNDEDFGFYNEGETTIKEKEGITDNVTPYTYTKLEYPCVVLRDGFTCAKHQIKVVSNMVKAKSLNKDIGVYFRDKGDMYRIGNICGMQLESFIDVLGRENVIGFYDDGTELVGDMIYCLCTFG